MRVTFVDKKSVFWSSTMMIMRHLVLIICILEIVNGWEHDEVGRGVHLREGAKCQIKTGEAGICKRVTTCNVYVEAIKQKTIEYSFLVRCSFKDKEEVICCPLDETTLNSGQATDRPLARNSIAPEVSSINQKTGVERPSQVACQKYIGVNPAGFAFHILDGSPVAPGQFPHMGGLIFPDGGGSKIANRCGSSLISERYALTAAHCVDDPVSQPTFVRFGVVVWTSNDTDFFPPVDVEIENITIYPGYRKRNHDIAIIKLSKNVDFTPFVRPACLYSDLRDIDSDTPLIIIGWGVTNTDTKARSDALLMTNVTTVDLKECNVTHFNIGLKLGFQSGLNEGQYCAYDPELKKDACHADSGGPMQLVRNKESTIVGIVSFGQFCATTTPSIYTRVAYYLDWIESIVWPS